MAGQANDFSQELDRIFRVEAPRVRARLVREFGDFDLVEDVLQETLVKAIQRWPREGVPDNPAAWLTTAAGRKAIDVFRHEQVRARVSPELTALYDHDNGSVADADGAGFDDDMLRLVFTCCHPALNAEARIALTLRTVADLTLEQVARAFLVAPRAMEQRLVRAKRKIRDAGIPFEIPERKHIAGRLGGVLKVVYLIFNEGYSASDGDALIRRELCAEAIRLMRLLNRLLRGRTEIDRAEPLALLALLLLQDSRADARADDAGDIVLLTDQDRSLWDRHKITEGEHLLDKALRMGEPPGPFQIQAAIAACHATAPRAEDTDWTEIALLYRRLLQMEDTAVVRLNHAVAVAMTGATNAAINLLEGLRDDGRMGTYHVFFNALGGVYLMAGMPAKAKAAYERALALATNGAERRFITRRLAGIGAPT